MTILTVLCQKVIASYENVIALLVRQYCFLHNLSTESIPSYPRVLDAVETGEEGADEETTSQSLLQGYEVDKFEEPCLFSGLVTLQLGILRAFLLRLKGVPETLGGEYFTLLDTVDKRVMKLGRFCSESCEV
jgi:hypothetical protein